MTNANSSQSFDLWVTDGGPAAVTRRVILEPIEGPEAVIFPPTFTLKDTHAERRAKAGQDVPGLFFNSKGEATGYNIDELPPIEPSGRPTRVCQIDSVGSQANRIEPLFAKPPYDALVPQVVIEAGEHTVNLLEAGHRAADAVVRCSSIGPKLDKAMKAIKIKGDATLLAQLAPTSLVFGFWDSRETQVKMPRIVRSVIRAFDVDVLRRSAQYSTTAGVILDGEKVEVTTKGKKAERGFAHVPAVHTHGGVLVRGEIRRDAILNLAALRSIHGADEDATTKLRRYILGLALVAFTANQETALREGCELIPALDDNGQPKETTKLVTADGQRTEFDLTADAALNFAREAAKVFGVGKGGKFPFDKKAAQEDLKKGKS
ncbi:MAG: type I-U CRISPR-associated protein Cas7 [Planctomycetes bacterium]|nr:type I-U CRISPR-associated protein Cas7 [Planctomycetota bacterium]